MRSNRSLRENRKDVRERERASERKSAFMRVHVCEIVSDIKKSVREIERE